MMLIFVCCCFVLRGRAFGISRFHMTVNHNQTHYFHRDRPNTTTATHSTTLLTLLLILIASNITGLDLGRHDLEASGY